jgi:hypothetical protein
MHIYKYESYDEYIKEQVAGNIAKLHKSWVKHDNMRALAAFLRQYYKYQPLYGLCHGSRRGNEQTWLTKSLPEGSKVYGTEISPTAKQFPLTFHWDFNKPIPECIEKCDFVYSNSQDHSPDPIKTFKVWSEQLKIGGLLILEHSDHHHSDHGNNKLDPTGFDHEADYLRIFAKQEFPRMVFIKSLDAPDKWCCKYLYFLIFERVS